MIDHLVSDPKKFGLIWSCILKVMNFLILDIFLKIFWIYLDLFFIFKIKKGFIPCADVEADVAGQAKCHHMAMHKRAAWCTCGMGQAHECAWVCVCVCVCMCVWL